METKKIEIEIPEGKTAKWVNGVLTLVDEERYGDIRDEVKTFEDACNVLNKRYNSEVCLTTPKVWTKHPLIREYDDINAQSRDLLVYLKLRIICAALNDGWKSEFRRDNECYFPYFCLFSEREVARLTEEKRKGLHLIKDGLRDSDWFAFGCAEADCGAVCYTSTSLVLRSEELAIYCGQQFIGLWEEYFFNKRVIV